MNLIDTIISKVDADSPDDSTINSAAAIIREGGLVAFPTETVYGLGADAANERAVQRIFEAKSRPLDNPVIVHVSSRDMLSRVVVSVTPAARRLISTFWPGPLTIVLERSAGVAPAVSAGLPTVAVRMPANTVALELIRAADTPIAAPSANASGRPSPTRAEHVARDLTGRIDMILDAGATHIGIESTVLDLSGDTPSILRPGWITREMIAGVIGPVTTALTGETLSRSPGTRHRHYTPLARVVLIEANAAISVQDTCRNYLEEGSVGFIGHTRLGLDERDIHSLILADDAEEYARAIYAAMRDLDEKRTAVIVIEGISEAGGGAAVMDRLRRAATEIIKA